MTSKKLSKPNTDMPRTGHHQNLKAPEPKVPEPTGETFSVHGESDLSFLKPADRFCFRKLCC